MLITGHLITQREAALFLKPVMQLHISIFFFSFCISTDVAANEFIRALLLLPLGSYNGKLGWIDFFFLKGALQLEIKARSGPLPDANLRAKKSEGRPSKEIQSNFPR